LFSDIDNYPIIASTLSLAIAKMRSALLLQITTLPVNFPKEGKTATPHPTLSKGEGFSCAVF
jgi:hypothetical protein